MRSTSVQSFPGAKFFHVAGRSLRILRRHHERSTAATSKGQGGRVGPHTHNSQANKHHYSPPQQGSGGPSSPRSACASTAQHTVRPSRPSSGAVLITRSGQRRARLARRARCCRPRRVSLRGRRRRASCCVAAPDAPCRGCASSPAVQGRALASGASSTAQLVASRTHHAPSPCLARRTPHPWLTSIAHHTPPSQRRVLRGPDTRGRRVLACAARTDRRWIAGWASTARASSISAAADVTPPTW
jgi:hypothetical protein